jgi:hypothetical protein
VLFAIALAVFAFAVWMGAFVAGGADSSGYLSQARLWEHASPITSEPLIERVDWPYADWTFTPLGYRPGVKRGTLVPIYSVGYPMMMGAIRRAFGPGAEMYVVPLTAAGLVLCAGILGTWLGGFAVGASTSLLLATSPPFVLQSLQPMSDVPTAFWWTLAVVLGVRRNFFCSVACAIAVALAILTRPNLAPLALPLVLLVLGERKDREGYNWRGTATVLSGALLGATVIAFLNTTFFGAATVSGYGAPGVLYKLEFLPTNLARYTTWLIQTESLLIVCTLAGFVFLIRSSLSRRWAIYGVTAFAIVLLSYVFYRPFDNWTYLRFFLPVYPLLFLSLASVSALVNRPAIRTLSLVVLTIVVCAFHVTFALKNGVLQTKRMEGKYLKVTDYLQQSLPANAIFICHQYSGSIRYYTDRRILRYDWLVPNRLEDAVTKLEALGYKPYFLLEQYEEPIFKARFSASSPLGTLDWRPSVDLLEARVRIYDPSMR